jgi:hypothetical protein
MCGECFLHGFASFPTYWEFDCFAADLLDKTAHRKMLLVTPRGGAATVRHPEAVYQCQSCGEMWALSSPDNAWRGYFLPASETTAHLAALGRKQGLKHFGCLLFLLLLLAIFLWNNHP